MRELHVVAVSEDGRHLVLGSSADASKGSHRLAIDTRLAAALRGELSQRPARAPRDAGAERPARVGGGGPPSVREIQSRLRTGESPEQIAASAGVPVESIARFAGPVLSEREEIIQRARATPLTRSRLGQSTLPLGEVLDRQFLQMAAMRPESVRWTTRREESGTWLVQVAYVARARSRSGSWRFDPRAGTLVAVDSVSAALGHSDNVEGTAAAIPVGSVSSAHAPAGRQKPVKRATKRASGPSDARRAARPAQSASARGARAAAGSGVAGTVPAPGTSNAKRAAGSRPTSTSARPAGPPDGPAGPPAGPAGPPTLRVVPEAGSPPADQAAAPKRAAGPRGRVSVPGWADVLLSTSPASPRPSDGTAD